MKEVIDRHSKRSIKVEVVDPVTITTKELLGLTSSFTSYLIRIETDHWAFSEQQSEVRRRFSEFCWLRNKLLHHHPNREAPPLPPKRYLHNANFNPKFIEQRCSGLEKFLQRVMRSFVYLSDAALHLFLQSDLSIREIEAKLHEEIKPNYVKRIHTSLTARLGQNKLKFARQRLSDSASNDSVVSDSESERTCSTSGDSDIDEHITLTNDMTPTCSPSTSSPITSGIKVIYMNTKIAPEDFGSQSKNAIDDVSG